MRRRQISIAQMLFLVLVLAMILGFICDRSEIGWVDSIDGDVGTGSPWFMDNQYQTGSYTKPPSSWQFITDRDVRYVSICNRRLTRTELARLRGFPNLECVRLLGKSFDETILDELARCTKLRIVDIRESNIGDLGFRKLTEIPQIQCIAYINSRVSNDEAREAEKRRPDITFLGWYF